MYWNNKTPEEKYLDNHPDSSLKEYVDYLKEEKKKARLLNEESEKKHRELLDSYVGKCFKVDFNGRSIMYFKLTTSVSKDTRVTAYEIYKDVDKSYMSMERNRYINVIWLPNQEEWYKDNYIKSSSIISEESFNEIVSIYENLDKAIKDLSL